MSRMLHSQEAGRIIITPREGGPVVEIPMLGCVHCGGHFEMPRFGNTPEDRATRIGRGWCFNCHGYICGKACEVCVPEDQYLENMEKGRPDDFRPIVVPVSFSARELRDAGATERLPRGQAARGIGG